MKHIGTVSCAAIILLSACTKTSLREELPTTKDDLVVATKVNLKKEGGDLVFTEPNLFPEGVVYDKFNNRFYVSSTTGGTIGIVESDGSYRPFIEDAALTATTGLEIDEARKLLYVANSTSGTVGVYNINTGERITIVDLTALLPNASAFFLNDIALDPQGNAYVTNSFAPVIFKITPGGDASIYYQSSDFATTGFGFNGIEYANQGFLLVAHTARSEVIKFPIENPSEYQVVSLDKNLGRPDGLLLSKSGNELVVVNNAGGGNGMVISFTSKDKWQSGTATNTFETGSVFPTTATSPGKRVYVLYAYLNKSGSSEGQAEYTIKQIPGIEVF